MPGDVLDVLKKAGDAVRSGEALLVLEAMKMEVEVKASSDGVVDAFIVDKGSKVAAGEVLVRIS